MSIQHQKQREEKQTKLQEECCDIPERIITSIGVDNWQWFIIHRVGAVRYLLEETTNMDNSEYG